MNIPPAKIIITKTKYIILYILLLPTKYVKKSHKMNDFKKYIIIFQWDKMTNNVINLKNRPPIYYIFSHPPKKLPFYYSLKLLLL